MLLYVLCRVKSKFKHFHAVIQGKRVIFNISKNPPEAYSCIHFIQLCKEKKVIANICRKPRAAGPESLVNYFQKVEFLV